MTRGISERAKARLLTAATWETVSNAVTGATFQPVAQPATDAPVVSYFAITSETVTDGYDQTLFNSPSQMHRAPFESDPNRTGMSDPTAPASIVAPCRPHALLA
ncbi:hypothetical protein D3C73_1079230 [compost metagenome]